MLIGPGETLLHLVSFRRQKSRYVHSACATLQGGVQPQHHWVHTSLDSTPHGAVLTTEGIDMRFSTDRESLIPQDVFVGPVNLTRTV